MTRVIAGKWKGRRLLTPEGMATRPTTDRCKEALFGVIQFELSDISFLDLFAGSGGIGIEALSRGAKSLDLVEQDPRAASVIRQNLSGLGAKDQGSLHTMSCERAIAMFSAARKQFDIVFMDPPYHQGYEQTIGQMVSDMAILKEGGLLIIESASDTDVSVSGLVLEKVKTYKTTRFSFFRNLHGGSV